MINYIPSLPSSLSLSPSLPSLSPSLSPSSSLMQAYDVALRLFELAEQLSAGNTETLLSMVCPTDSHADDNPVFVLCRNDACSFTWTGEEHVQQVGGVRWVES